jgi:hypothetical protein
MSHGPTASPCNSHARLQKQYPEFSEQLKAAGVPKPMEFYASQNDFHTEMVRRLTNVKTGLGLLEKKLK